MTTPQTGMPEGLKIGDHVPDFTLQAGMGENHTLSDYQQRRNIVLVFLRPRLHRRLRVRARRFGA